MAKIPIWPGSSSFSLTPNPTPFAFYDDDYNYEDLVGVDDFDDDWYFEREPRE